MKFEGGVFKPTGNEPDEMEDFFKYFQFVTRFFEKFNKTKLSVVDNVASYNATVTIPHGIVIKITHGLGYVPNIVTANGRVEFIQIIDSTVSTVTIKAKLMTTSIIGTTPNRPQNRMLVANSDFFYVGDSIRIGQNTRELMGIDKGKLILKENVTYGESVNTASLAAENCKVFII